jgi:hypothetical protein
MRSICSDASVWGRRTPRDLVQRDGGRIRDIQTFHHTGLGNAGQGVAGFAHKTTQSTAFGSQHQRHRAPDNRGSDRLIAGPVEPDTPEVIALENVEGAGKICLANNVDGFEPAGGRLGEHTGLASPRR